MEYEPDADMLFNYLLVAALAESTDTIESKNLNPSEGTYSNFARYVLLGINYCLLSFSAEELQDLARKKMMEMVERILVEADLPDEVSKLDSYGRTLPGLRELLGLLMKQDGHTGKQLRRQVGTEETSLGCERIAPNRLPAGGLPVRL